MRRAISIVIAVLIVGAVSIFMLSHAPSPTTVSSEDIVLAASSTEYAHPEIVTIQGYSGPQEDPVLSPDGQYLFFDSHNDAGLPMYLYMAKRIDYKTFNFVGRVQGVDLEAVEAVEDSKNNFYFVSPLLLRQGSATTIGRGMFSDGSVTGVAPIQGISPKSPKSGSQGITFDIYVTPDGNILYFSDFVVNAQFRPQSAQLALAAKNADGTFTRLSNSDEILENINALGSLVYNATPSADGLILAFNASPSFPIPTHIYIATRNSISDPFGKPQYLAAADVEHNTELAEPGSFSPDGKYLYFHRVIDKKSSQIYLLTRN